MNKPICPRTVRNNATSNFVTRKEIAAAADISVDTLQRKPELAPIRKAIEETRDHLSDKPVRCHRQKLRTRLSLYGHGELAEKI